MEATLDYEWWNDDCGAWWTELVLSSLQGNVGWTRIVWNPYADEEGDSNTESDS